MYRLLCCHAFITIFPFIAGFLINFISQPVISGFTSAAAINIASSQLKPLFGLTLKTRGLIDTWMKVFSNIKDFRWQDLTLGLVCIVLLLILKVSGEVYASR